MPENSENNVENNAAPAIGSGQLILPDENATREAAARLAPCLQPGMVIHLAGDLGAGKTTFCRALLRSLGYNGRVKSPTFTLVEPYNLSVFSLYHFDFYRFSSESELRDAGFEEQLDSDAVALVEWPDRAGASLPAPDLRLSLSLPAQLSDASAHDDQVRELSMQAFTVRGQSCLSALVGSKAGAS